MRFWMEVSRLWSRQLHRRCQRLYESTPRRRVALALAYVKGGTAKTHLPLVKTVIRL